MENVPNTAFQLIESRADVEQYLDKVKSFCLSA